MTQKLEEHGDAEQSEVASLLRQRTTVQEWLLRLEEQRGRVSDRVMERVRDDYERRLQNTLESLAAHRLGVQEELERATSSLVAAEDEHERAVDELEEGRLRNIIGELQEDNWKEAEVQLEEAVSAAAEREATVRAETERLRDLLDQLDEREPQQQEPVFSLDAAYEADEEPPPPAAPEPVDELPTLESPPRTFSRAESDAFLDEIDRALTNAPDVRPDAPKVRDENGLPEEDTAPKPGLKCGECGYTNDLSAWFCGVCGADVG